MRQTGTQAMNSRRLIPGFLSLGMLVAGFGDAGTLSDNRIAAAAEKSEQKRAHLVKRAERGDVRAQSALGRMYFEGEGVRADAAMAFDWWQKAAAQGDASSQYALGIMYRSGNGVPKNAARAFEWIQKAAEQDHVKAQVTLGSIYLAVERGTGTASIAAAWFDRAAARGNAEAQSLRAAMYRTG